VPCGVAIGAGYALGGGIGWYARKLGLATNSLTAVELVLADGSIVRADATTHSELFWAVRGGGGNFGVVTALEFALFEIETAYAGMLLWDVSRAEPVLRRWAAWVVDAAGRGHHLVPGHAPAAAARAAGVPPWPLRGDHRRRRAGRRRGGRRHRRRAPDGRCRRGFRPRAAQRTRTAA